MPVLLKCPRCAKAYRLGANVPDSFFGVSGPTGSFSRTVEVNRGK